MTREIKFRVWDENNKKMEIFRLPHNPDIFFKYNLNTNFMQYTGVNDKNGKEIYEEDIVRIGNGKICFVKFNKGGFYARDWFEVLGNAFENPELVGAK